MVNRFGAFCSEGDPALPEEFLRKWITHQVLMVLKNLEGYLENISDGSGVKALLEQAIFFSKRLSDEGADFVSSVLRLFSNSVESHFVKSMTTAFTRLSSTLDEEHQVSIDWITVPLFVGGASISVSVANNVKQVLVDETWRIVNLLIERAVFLRSAGSKVVGDVAR
eukprot:gene39512-48152_t